jgi:hypothetical protein
LKKTILGLFVFAFLLGACAPSRQVAPSNQQDDSASSQDAPEAEASAQAGEESAADESATGEEETVDAAREVPDLSDLPIGDGNISTEPRIGYVWSCRQHFDEDAGGASATGDWYHANAGTWDSDIKPEVDGAVSWDYQFGMRLEGDTRVIEANGVPFHVTGIYPISRSDDAYQYDTNPHSVEEQRYFLELPANPTVAAEATCVGGTEYGVGIAISGVVINSALDAPGRDAVATEIQDQCQGHPHASGVYHYHGYSLCLEDQNASGHSALIGWALDGFGLYGPYGENGEVLTNQDLEECHGHTHMIDWDGEVIEMFHYHATFEYPYTIGCFRGELVGFENTLSGGIGDTNGGDTTGPNDNGAGGNGG